MLILVSNDDGYRAPGLAVLATQLRLLGEVVVVAPDKNRSGASNSLTLDRPLRWGRADSGFYWVDGTPTDCVHIAINELLERKPDMVVAGVNAGENLGDDVLYSGTVAAAMEGCLLGCPALAVSLAGVDLDHYAGAASIARDLVRDMHRDAVEPNWLLNVNVPDQPIEKLRGIKVTRLGQRHKAAAVVRQTDPKGRPMFWIGPPGPGQDAGPGTDFEAVTESYISVTPLHVDLTAHRRLDDLFNWLETRPANGV
jgi:5'-nucleotidase